MKKMCYNRYTGVFFDSQTVYLKPGDIFIACRFESTTFDIDPNFSVFDNENISFDLCVFSNTNILKLLHENRIKTKMKNTELY